MHTSLNEMPPLQQLGELLTLNETEKLLSFVTRGRSISEACEKIDYTRRPLIKNLLEEAGLQAGQEPMLSAILAGILGAKSGHKKNSVVWTVPRGVPENTASTASVRKMIQDAQLSITCSTFNYTETSTFHQDLKQVMEERDVVVTLYVDGQVGKPHLVKKNLPDATVYYSKVGSETNAKGVVKSDNKFGITSHAKFIIVDRRVVFVTSANLSLQAELFNVELGLRVEDTTLANSVEGKMASMRGAVYVQVK